MSMPSFLPPPDLPGADAFSRWGDHRHLAVVFEMAPRIMVLSGAGLSAPSGIPTYRGRGGKWTVQDPILHGQFVADEASRLEQWRRSCDDLEAFGGAEPNAGHRALTRLAASRQVFLATQNVDGLHADAGFPEDRMVELHGNGRRVRCMSCGKRTPFDAGAVRSEVEAGRPPACACGGLLKPDVTLFGANLEPGVMERAVAEADGCIAFLAVGSSLSVNPAAGLLEVAMEGGAVVVVAVDGITPYHGAAHLLLAGDAVAHLDAAVAGLPA